MDDETDTVRTQGAAQPAAGETPRASYDRDFYTWSQEQGRLYDTEQVNPRLRS